MGALAVLLLGMAIVVCGVLLLRLHAFVALILAALTVACLTPARAVERQHLLEKASKSKVRLAAIEADGRTVRLAAPTRAPFEAPGRLVLIRPGRDPWKYQTVGQIQIDADTHGSEAGVEVSARVALSDGITAVDAGDLPVLPRDLEAATSAGKVAAPERVASGFGATATGVAILIAFASIVGKCLLDSGAADRVVRSALKVTGEVGAPRAFVASGFVLGIPVFFDTVFYLMLPLGKALRLQTGRNYLLYVLAIIAGATMAHSLVPPTPGPLVAAEMLGVGLGRMILLGCLVGVGTSASGYLWAVWLNRRVTLPLRDASHGQSADGGAEEDPASPWDTAGAPDLPPLWLSLLPILLPVVLIGGREVWRAAAPPGPALAPLIDFLGNKNVAIILAAAVAVVTLLRQRRKSLRQIAPALQDSLAGAGTIILVTSAGGAFGAAIGQSGVATLIGQLPAQSLPAQLTLAFLITVAIRTAQGSATVAMITAAGIFAPLAASGSLPYDPVWLALAIGCGSKAIAWMNDSGFWVITQMSGMTEAEGLKYVTPMMMVMAVAGLLLIIAGAMLFPLG